jgi:hypothetical protein
MLPMRWYIIDMSRLLMDAPSKYRTGGPGKKHCIAGAVHNNAPGLSFLEGFCQ